MPEFHMGTGDPNSCQHRRYVTHGAFSSPCRAIFCEILIWQPVFCLCSPIVSIMSRYVHMSTVVLSEHLLCAFHPDENYDSLGPDPALPASLALLYLLEAHQLWWSRGGAGADVILLLLFPQHFRRLPFTQAFPLWLHFRRLLLPLGNSWKLQDAILSGISG